MKKITDLQKRLLAVATSDYSANFYLEDDQGDLHYQPNRLEMEDLPKAWIGFALLQYGDYNNTTTVERSNCEVFSEKYDGAKWMDTQRGSYGHHEIIISVTRFRGKKAEQAIEELEGLSDYPVLDEDHMSKLETQIQDESWDNYARDDFFRALCRQCEDLGFSESFLEKLGDYDSSSGEVYSLFRVLCDVSNTYWVHEDPNSAFIDIDRIVEAVGETIKYRVWIGGDYFDPPFTLSEQGISRILFPEEFKTDPRQVEINLTIQKA